MGWASRIIPYILLAVVAFGLHFCWEYLHLPLYTGYEALGQGTQLILWATSGDLLYSFFAILFIAACKRNLAWFKNAGVPEYILLAVLGFVTAVFVEYKAMVLHRWAYTDAMPTLLGFGLSPLIQMTLLLPLSVYLTTYFLKGRGQTPK